MRYSENSKLNNFPDLYYVNANVGLYCAETYPKIKYKIKISVKIFKKTKTIMVANT